MFAFGVKWEKCKLYEWMVPVESSIPPQKEGCHQKIIKVSIGDDQLFPVVG